MENLSTEERVAKLVAKMKGNSPSVEDVARDVVAREIADEQIKKLSSTTGLSVEERVAKLVEQQKLRDLIVLDETTRIQVRSQHGLLGAVRAHPYIATGVAVAGLAGIAYLLFQKKDA